MVTAAILAGGLGMRMGNSELPKQFMKINNEPIINRTIDVIMRCKEIERVLIAVQPTWRSYLFKIISSKDWSNKTDIIDGGSTRLESIENAVDFLYEKYYDRAENVVLLHDAVRPFVPIDLLECLVQDVRIYHAVTPCVPVTDTLLWSEDGQGIDSIPQRSKLYHGQTPEAFDVNLIRKCIHGLSEEEREINTGTAQICTTKGVRVHMIHGDQRNIKITTKADYEQAELYFNKISEQSFVRT